MALGLAWVGAVSAAAQSAAGEGFALVVSPDVRDTTVSRADAVSLVLGQKHYWSSGARVVVLSPASGSAERRFMLQSMCRLTEIAYRRHTLEQLYRGDIEYAPKVVDDDINALRFIAAGHGAITIVATRVAREAHARILRVDGRLPGEAGYALTPR